MIKNTTHINSICQILTVDKLSKLKKKIFRKFDFLFYFETHNFLFWKPYFHKQILIY